MKNILWIIVIIIILALISFAYDRSVNNGTANNGVNTSAENSDDQNQDEPTGPVQVIPISHASAILQWEDMTIYTDPTGGAAAYEGKAPADLIVITDIHGDHLSTSTLSAIIGNAVLVVPQAVKDLLPADLASRAKVLKNDESIDELGFDIEAIPMYNLPEAKDSRHVKGRGNGYVIEKDGFRVYVAGDTSGIPEMRDLDNIDIALVPMNPPFTMTVEEAADAVLDFKPVRVFPYHYRSQDGLSDVNKFKQLVSDSDPDIEVVLLNWYPAN